MPDISMCANANCPARATCYRHRESGTQPNEFMQAYMAFSPPPGADRCADYIHGWNLKPRAPRRKETAP